MAKAAFNSDGILNLDEQKNKFMKNLDEMLKKSSKKEDLSDGTISN